MTGCRRCGDAPSRGVRKKARAEAVKLARSLGRNVDDSASGLASGVDEVLAELAFMFSNLWLDDVLGRALNPSLPQMQNTDGEPLEFITVHFPLVPKSNPPAIRAALDDLPPLRKESDAFWNWVEEKKALRRKSAKGQAGDTETFGTTMDDGAIVLGNIELTEKAVTLSVNSEARAARGRALLEPILAGLVRAPLVERQTVEQMMALSRDRSSAQHALRLPPDEERRIIHQSLTDHYRRTLDERIPKSRQPVAAQGGEDRERSGEGDRLVEDAGEPFRTAGAGRSGRQLRLHLDLEGTWPRRRASMNRSSDLHRALSQER